MEVRRHLLTLAIESDVIPRYRTLLSIREPPAALAVSASCICALARVESQWSHRLCVPAKIQLEAFQLESVEAHGESSYCS